MSEVQISQLATDLVKEIQQFLTLEDYTGALSAINDNKYDLCLRDNAWDLIPVLVQHLNKDTNVNNTKLFQCCEELLKIVAEKSNPAEVLLEFIEQAELAKDDLVFLSILKALQIILLRLTTKRGQSLEWCFNTIQRYVSEFPLPGDYNLDCDETALMDANDSVQRISLFYSEILDFYKPFVDEIKLPGNIPLQKRRDALACVMLQLLGKPLACLDLECGLKGKSRARTCAERIMLYLSQLVGDCFKFLRYIPDRRTQTDDEPIQDVFACEFKTPLLSLGVYYYLILSENIQYNPLPVVYIPLYKFQSVFYLVAELLKYTEQFITKKGLLLAHAIICSDDITVFPYEILDSTAHCSFCKHLTNIMIYSDIKINRELALKIFKTYIYKFDTKGRYLLLANLMDLIKHTNTRAFLIQQYKTMIHQAFQSDENKIPEFFHGPQLYKMIDTFCHLPEGPESDLIDLGEQFITTLNLLIYLTIRDKYNATGIWDHFDTLKTSFFKPLKEGLKISKAHYELRMKELTDEVGQGDSANVNVQVHGCPLPKMSYEDQMSVLYAASNNFHALDTTLARLEELIETSGGHL